jgi:phage shock protein PspC (stress-responsive transcriptional regulator)
MKKLYRNKNDYKIAGVCSGMGEYFDIDPVIIRLLFLLAFFLGAGLIVYIIGWIIIPVKD